MELLDGRLVSTFYKNMLMKDTAHFANMGLRKVKLTAILVGNNPASQFYIQSKVKNCHEVGVNSELIHFPDSVPEEILLNTIKDLNNPHNDVDGILVQLPLPNHISESKIIAAIAPDKDVDGFHPLNVGRMVLGEPTFIPATPLGVTMLLEYYKITTAGKQVVILGRSNIVGRPLSILLSSQQSCGNATVTLCHSYTKDIKAIAKRADILIVALGKPGFVKKDFVKYGAVVVDVGINQVKDEKQPKGYRIVGDVAYDDVSPFTSYITPVPGGVGLMTIVGLLSNTIKAFKIKFNITI
ncbi:MAG: bifunctional 5,10-methylenetetrahydrofolate dehydrogenase/5,10-methenyltetrahydrofolate cyclohydrolase [Phycisphaerales bacterium]|nr:bifunctional 5,10-methylenetetrahydrofolate dehydrogenase/5,10-methenyltetrahydrofolate cyclohydrolase [Phycisphaerales bacterium]